MLDQQDIKQIGQIVEEKIDQRVGAIVEEKIDAVFDRKFDSAFDRKFTTSFDAAFDRNMDSAIEQKIVPRITEAVHKELGEVLEHNLMPTLEQIQNDINGLKGEVRYIKRDMVTKWYLDDKLGDLRGDLIGLARNQDKKTNFMIESLDANDVLPEPDIKFLRQMEVFPSPSRSNI